MTVRQQETSGPADTSPDELDRRIGAAAGAARVGCCAVERWACARAAGPVPMTTMAEMMPAAKPR